MQRKLKEATQLSQGWPVNHLEEQQPYCLPDSEINNIMVHKRLQLFTAVLENYEQGDLRQIHKRVIPSCDWIIYHNELPAESPQKLRIVMWFNTPKAKNFVSRMFNKKNVEACTDSSKGPSYWLARCSTAGSSHESHTDGRDAIFSSSQDNPQSTQYLDKYNLFQHGVMPDDSEYLISLARATDEKNSASLASGQNDENQQSFNATTMNQSQLLSLFVKASSKARLSKDALLKKFPSIVASFPDFVEAVQSHFNPPVTKAAFTVFSEPLQIDIQNLVVTGPTGIGKTQFALAHFASPLRVTNLVQLKMFNQDIHDGIVFDDMQFCHCGVDEQLRVLGWDFDETVYDLLGQKEIAVIPAFTRKIFTCELNRYPFSHEEAITRRVRVNVYYSLFDPLFEVIS